MVNQKDADKPTTVRKAGRPRLPKALKRVRLHIRISKVNLDYIQALDAPNDGRAIDLVISKYRDIFGKPKQPRRRSMTISTRIK